MNWRKRIPEPNATAPEIPSPAWHDQVALISKALRTSTTKRGLSFSAILFMFDLSFSRSAICQAIHDVEIEKGWHS